MLSRTEGVDDDAPAGVRGEEDLLCVLCLKCIGRFVIRPRSCSSTKSLNDGPRPAIYRT